MKHVILSLLFVACVVILAACTPRDVLTAEEFTIRMEAEGYEVEDVTAFATGVPDLVTFVVADTGDFSVEFVVFDTDAAARRRFNIIQRYFEDGAGRTRSTREQSVANYSRFQQSSDGRFEAVTRVENTIVTVETTIEHRDAALAVLEVLGY